MKVLFFFSKRNNFHTDDILLKSKQTLKPTTLKSYLSKKECLCENTFYRKTYIQAAEQFLPKYSSNYMNLCLEVLLWFRTLFLDIIKESNFQCCKEKLPQRKPQQTDTRFLPSSCVPSLLGGADSSRCFFSKKYPTALLSNIELLGTVFIFNKNPLI